MTKLPINYSKSVIYKIVSKNPEIQDCYVGSTTNLTQRKYRHKQSIYDENDRDYLHYKSLFMRENGGWENFEFIVLEHCKDITNGQELRLREREWFDKLKPTLNTNKPNISIDEKKKYYKEWKKKKYNHEIIECGCGSKIKRRKLWDHLQTKKHKKYIESLQ